VNAERQLERWEQAWLKSPTNALLFVTDVLGASPEPWQCEALRLISENDRLSIRAGHGVGKTTFIAWVVLWFMLTRFPFKIPITANSQDQLRDVVWPELRKWRDKLPEPLKVEVEVTAERLFLKAAPEAFAVARTASKDNPEALQGFHEDNLLFVIEEASGIEDIVFEVAQGALSTPGAKVVMCANPTRTSGYFYDTHHALRSRWKPMRVNSEDVPRARGHIEDIIAKYGKDSNAYRVRVLGEFPDTEDDAVIPLALCEAAAAREIQTTSYRPVWGLDVARFGDDRTALCKRRGNTVLEPVKFWRGKDTMQVAGLVVQEWKDTDEDDRPSEILVDVIGLGAGVVDRLLELGLPVRGVNVGEAAAVSDRYMRLRDELWFRARDWLAGNDVKLPPDEALIGELTGPKYRIESSGKIKVESKDDMKKRGLQSPDLADAFILTLAGGLDRIPDERIDRYRRGLAKKRRGVSGWSY
jgi:phage terminase large subunit